MIEKNALIKVTNRDSGFVGYSIPDLNNLYRKFAPGETKNITFEELEKLSWIQGGKRIIKNYLIIDNEEAVAELLGEVEPEYYYSEEDIKKLLSPVGTLDQLEDCLQYAPDGVLDLIKQIAVETKLNDIAKRDAIHKALGFDVSAAISINEASKEDLDLDKAQPAIANGNKRRSAPITERKSNPIVIKK